MTAVFFDIVNYVRQVFWGNRNLTSDKRVSTRQSSTPSPLYPTLYNPTITTTPFSHFAISSYRPGVPYFYHPWFYPVLNHISTTPYKPLAPLHLLYFPHSGPMSMLYRPLWTLPAKSLYKPLKSYLTDTLSSLRLSPQFLSNPSPIRFLGLRVAPVLTPVALTLFRSIPKFNAVVTMPEVKSQSKSHPHMKSEETQTDDNPYVV